MNSLWSNLYDRFKDKRYGALFLASLLLSLGLLISTQVFERLVNEPELQWYLLRALPGVGLLTIAWGLQIFRVTRPCRRERHTYPALSRDELRAARSKLLKERKDKI